MVRNAREYFNISEINRPIPGTTKLELIFRSLAQQERFFKFLEQSRVASSDDITVFVENR